MRSESPVFHGLAGASAGAGVTTGAGAGVSVGATGAAGVTGVAGVAGSAGLAELATFTGASRKSLFSLITTRRYAESFSSISVPRPLSPVAA